MPLCYLPSIFCCLSYSKVKHFLGCAIAGWASTPTQPDTQQRELAAFNWFTENYAFTMLLTLPLYTFFLLGIQKVGR